MRCIWIIGAGKFGKKAVIAVSKKMKNSKIKLVDKNYAPADLYSALNNITESKTPFQ